MNNGLSWQINTCLEQLKRMAVTGCPKITGLSFQAAKGAAGDVLAASAFEELKISWDGKLTRDWAGAPYLPEWRQECQASLSLTEDGGLNICLAALHGHCVLGVGVDLASPREFDTAVMGGAYCGGSLFTHQERQLLKGRNEEEMKQTLACLFAGKEAAFKSMSPRIRDRIAREDAINYRAEFRDFELCSTEKKGQYFAVSRNGTKETVKYLGIGKFLVFTAAEGEYAIAMAVSLMEG